MKRLPLVGKFSFKSEFARNVAHMMSGTVIAQIISFSTTPLMTRLFTPQDYGFAALYVSVSSLLIVAATGQYSSAVILADSDEDAVNVVSLSLAIALILSLATFLIVAVFNGVIAGLLKSRELAFWLYWLPLSILQSAFLLSVASWFQRQKKFKTLASLQIVVAIAATLIQLVVSLVHPSGGGLIFSSMAAQGVNSVILSWLFWKEYRDVVKLATVEKAKAMAKKHRSFPLYVLPSQLLNVATNQVPVMLINTLAGAVALGHYNLTQRLMGLPSGLISSSITEVFKQRASSDYIKYGNCRDIYVKTLKSLLLISVLPFIVLFVSAPWLFAIVFGESWRMAGEYARVLSIMYFLRFTSSPLSYVYFIADKQKENLFLQFYMVVSTLLSLYAGYIFFHKPLYIILCFSLNYSAIYVLYLIRTYSFSKGK